MGYGITILIYYYLVYNDKLTHYNSSKNHLFFCFKINRLTFEYFITITIYNQINSYYIFFYFLWNVPSDLH